MAFTRDDMVRMAKQAGWTPGTTLAQHQLTIRQAIVAAIRSAIQSDTSILEDAPRVRYADMGTEKFRRMNLADALDAVRDELDAIRQ